MGVLQLLKNLKELIQPLGEAVQTREPNKVDIQKVVKQIIRNHKKQCP
jgi:hypothetical protein